MQGLQAARNGFMPEFNPAAANSRPPGLARPFAEAATLRAIKPQAISRMLRGPPAGTPAATARANPMRAALILLSAVVLALVQAVRWFFEWVGFVLIEIIPLVIIRLFSLALYIVGILVILTAAGLFVYQCSLWLHDDAWTPIAIRNMVEPPLQTDMEMKGLERIINWILDCPLTVAIFISGAVLAAIGRNMTRIGLA
jgi:hypothetical protein